MSAGVPAGDVVVPEVVAALAGGEVTRVVWRNELGGLTFVCGVGQRRRYLKWTPAESGIDLAVEATKLRWAAAWVRVPRVLEQGADESGSWLVTAALPGENAVAARWRAEPAVAVAALGAGLRALHEALPVAECPFSWSVTERSAHLDEVAGLGQAPPIDRYVVCHGDTCAPNTLIDDDGRFAGHVDLGSLGVADRWADLGTAAWSADFNYGPGWVGPLLDAYGIAEDTERLTYYRRLWEST
ncbi:aminoglycoside 3'-phosphotransferase [Nocardia sp. BMG111209]|uniref:aminoglycoside 3'-phosphotransferase n=1 Tax=Nocardia sp. BMG111209 TaxID=1160137 RepID=UPI000362E60C|nr:aminoglycoside 3'-phosphotransferase [Nocardia sp. BMG111209]